MKKSWKKEVARDLMALGSFPFIILVLVRVLMVANFKIIFHVIVSELECEGKSIIEITEECSYVT